MASPIVDLHIKSIIEYEFSLLRAEPDIYFPDVFGVVTEEPYAALLGKSYLESIKKWFLQTEIPIVLGYNLSETRVPIISITLASMQPSQPFIGDSGLYTKTEVQQYARDILVPDFQAETITFSDDKTYAILTLQSNMPDFLQDIFFPGCNLRDAKQQEFVLSTDPVTTNPRIDPLPGGPPVTDIDSSVLQVITPYSDAVVKNGTMFYEYQNNVQILANSGQMEGEWLFMLTMWALLRGRPLMAKLFGLDPAFSSAGDYSLDASKSPEHVWIRTISLVTKALWSWREKQQTDILGFLTFLSVNRANLPGNPPVLVTTQPNQKNTP